MSLFSAIERAILARWEEDYLPGVVLNADGTMALDRIDLDFAMAKMIRDSTPNS